MSKSEYQNRATGVVWAGPGQTAGAEGLPDKLQGLFGEVTGLANQLRKAAVLVHGRESSLAGGWSILQVLERLGPQTVPGIARIRLLSRQNIQTLVNRLESGGYVARTANPAHKRSGLVQLTERGERLLAAVMEREAKARERLLPYVAETRLIPAVRLLRQLRELLAGHELPPADLAGGRPAHQRRRGAPKATRRKEAAAVVADVPPAPEAGEPEEGEFPVNLL